MPEKFWYHILESQCDDVPVMEEFLWGNCPIHKATVRFSSNYHIRYSVPILRLVVRILDHPYGRYGHARGRWSLVTRSSRQIRNRAPMPLHLSNLYVPILTSLANVKS